MSQILDAIEKADAARKHGDKAKLTQQEALSHVVHSTPSTPRTWVWLFSVLACLGVALICVSLYLVVLKEKGLIASRVETQNIHVGEQNNIINKKTEAKVDSRLSRPSLDIASDAVSDTKKVISAIDLTMGASNQSASSIIEVNSVDLPEIAPKPKVVVDLPKRELKKNVRAKPPPKKNVSRETVKKPSQAAHVPHPVPKKSPPKKTSDQPAARQTSLFRINVLMFDEDVSSRFVIVQGKRLQVGDKVPNTDYHVSAIRRDGVIVESEKGAMFVKAL